jgi:hypothetical protein
MAILEEENIIYLARAPGQVADQGIGSGAVATRVTRSGNPQFDPATGRFAGSGSTKQSQVPDVQIVAASRTLPQGVTQEQWERRLDVIRELARKSLEYDDKSLVNLLKKHPNVQNLAAIDIQALKNDIRAQQVDDLVDIMDSKLSAIIDSKSSVRLQAPQRWIKQAVARFTDEEILDVAKRLEGRGYGVTNIKKNLVGQVVNEDRRKKLEQLYSESRKQNG